MVQCVLPRLQFATRLRLKPDRKARAQKSSNVAQCILLSHIESKASGMDCPVCSLHVRCLLARPKGCQTSAKSSRWSDLVGGRIGV